MAMVLQSVKELAMELVAELDELLDLRLAKALEPLWEEELGPCSVVVLAKEWAHELGLVLEKEKALVLAMEMEHELEMELVLELVDT